MICPDFIWASGDLSIIRDPQFGIGSPDPEGTRRLTIHRKQHPVEVTFVFQVHATRFEGAPVVDDAGRALFSAYGIVHEKALWEGEISPESLLEHETPGILEHLRLFHDTTNTEPVVSTARQVESLSTKSGPGSLSRRSTVLLIIMLAAIAVGVVWMATQKRHSKPVAQAPRQDVAGQANDIER